jgi:hypothetical protein
MTPTQQGKAEFGAQNVASGAALLEVNRAANNDFHCPICAHDS